MARIEVLSTQNNAEGIMWKDITQAIDKAVKQDKVLFINPLPVLPATYKIIVMLMDLGYNVQYDASFLINKISWE